MLRCFELAKKAGKNTKSNPNVGCVIVHEGKIIGEGYHKFFGGKHAEIEAIESVKNKELLKKSTLFVSLEPCCHTGKTPPCTYKIIETGIPHVVISTLDPNPQVAGQGIKLLLHHGLLVETRVLEKEGKELLRKFEVNLQKRPYIILKIVQSIDGYIGSKDQQVWLSNSYSTLLSHKWRSEVDGIMVGTKTVLTDNPSLTTRTWPGDNPVRIIWDRNLILSKNLKIFNPEAKTFILNEHREGDAGHITYLNIKDKSNSEILGILFTRGICSMIIEGGSQTISRFYQDDLWDEARIITVPKKLESFYTNLIKALEIKGLDTEYHDLDGDIYKVISKELTT
jgi:diaminohydroxyphosphoribosylaminopyrimidine deaminase/5-amino-6-(5-phosphoribosylamino)uracil reductase